MSGFSRTGREMFIKICGITRFEDAQHAAACGATALGFVFWSRSPRYVTPSSAARIVEGLPAGITTVGLFVDATVDHIRRVMGETGISAVQLHGAEPPTYAAELGCEILRAVTVEAAEAACTAWPEPTQLLIDAIDPERRGGTGQTVDWTKAAVIARRRPIVLAGGLTEANVEEAVAAVGPSGVDVASGVEDAPGVKNPDKVARFLARARSALERYEVSHR